MKEKGYDKWQELAYSIYGIIQMSNVLRKDLTVILVMHSQTERDENTGEKFTRAKTSGVQSMFTFSASFICSALDFEQEAADTTNAQSARAFKIFFIIVSDYD